MTIKWTVIEIGPPLREAKRFEAWGAFPDDYTSGIGWIARGAPTTHARATRRAALLNRLLAARTHGTCTSYFVYRAADVARRSPLGYVQRYPLGWRYHPFALSRRPSRRCWASPEAALRGRVTDYTLVWRS